MTTVEDLRAEALFCTLLQPSERPDLPLVRDAAVAAAFRHGEGGCAELVAQEFGDHPDVAAKRMQWCRREVEAAYAEAACR